MNERVPLTIWTDGSCTTKGDRKGGMGVYMQFQGQDIGLKRGYWNTTTPRMEMRALIAAVQMVCPDIYTDVVIWCDSKFIVDAIMNGSLRKWRADGWKGVANPDLWKDFVTEVDKRRKMRLYVRHINGHQKNILDDTILGNHMADALADYRNQDSYTQDKPLEGFSWFHHEGTDVVFIEKTERYEELNKMGDIFLIGDCYYATDEELFDRLNETALFDAYYSGRLDVDLQIKTI